jgi:hypothetical protein
MADDDSYYYNVLDVVQPRSYLRFSRMGTDPIR